MRNFFAFSPIKVLPYFLMQTFMAWVFEELKIDFSILIFVYKNERPFLIFTCGTAGAPWHGIAFRPHPPTPHLSQF